MDLENLAVHAESLRGLARRLVGDGAAADDVVQEACLAALRRRPPEGTPWRPWLVGVVKNLSLRRRRDEARRAAREQRAARPEAVAPADEAVERAELYRALLDELLALDEPYRATLLLRHLEGLSHAAIAARLGVPAGTVSARLHRGLEILRGRLDRRFGGRVAWCVLFLPFVKRPSAAAWGVAAVSAKKTFALAVVLLLALGALVGTLLSDRAEEPAARSGRNAAAPSGPPATPDEASLPPPVDPEAVDRDLDLHGVVVDAAGAPVPGARVEAFWYPWQRGSMGTGDRLYVEEHGPDATAAQDGSFALRLRRGQQVNLRASAQGFATSELASLQAGERVRIVLGAGVCVVFECMDKAGKAVAGAGLRLYRAERESLARNFVDRRGETGADGRCTFDALPAGEWGYLAAGHARYASVWRRVAFPASGEALVRVVMHAGRMLHGTVRDIETQAHVAGARVGVSLARRQAVTDAMGRYEFPGWGLDGGVENLVAEADGYSRQSKWVGPDDVQDFALRRGSDLSGRIVGADGSPVAGALLCVRGRDTANDFATQLLGGSGGDGRFLLHGIGRGIANTLTVAAMGHARYVLDFDAPPDGTAVDLGDVKLPAPHGIEGRVLLADGTVAAGILVNLEGGNADRGRLRPGAEVPYRTAVERDERRTDDLGRLRFSDLAPGAYTLTCATPGYKGVPLDVTVPEVGSATGIELRLPGGHDLTVRLRDTEGRPVWGVFVQVLLADQWTLSVLSDTAGVARFHADAAFESVDLSDFDRGRHKFPPPRPLPSGTTDVSLVVEPAGIAEGIVLDQDGRPLPEAALRIVSGGEPVDQGGGGGFSGLDGKFRVVVAARGATDILLTGVVIKREDITRELPPFGGRLEGVAAGATGLVLQARPLTFDHALSVRVLAPDGSPLRGAQVYARTATGALVPGANVLTDAAGAASLKGLPDADIGVWAKAVRHPGAEDWIDASAFPVFADGQAVTLRLRQGLRVRGRVVAGEGKPVPEASVYAYRKTDLVQTVQTDAEGTFSMLVPADTEMPLKLVAMKWEGRTLLEASIDGWEPDDDEALLRLAPRGA